MMSSSRGFRKVENSVRQGLGITRVGSHTVNVHQKSLHDTRGGARQLQRKKNLLSSTDRLWSVARGGAERLVDVGVHGARQTGAPTSTLIICSTSTSLGHHGRLSTMLNMVAWLGSIKYSPGHM
jgi:hypothetical protein